MPFLFAFLRLFYPPPLWVRQHEAVRKLCNQLIKTLYHRKTGKAYNLSVDMRGHVHFLLTVAERLLHALIWLRAVQILGYGATHTSRIMQPAFSKTPPTAKALRLRLDRLLKRYDTVDALTWRLAKRIERAPLRLASRSTSPTRVVEANAAVSCLHRQSRGRWMVASSRPDGGGPAQPRAPPHPSPQNPTNPPRWPPPARSLAHAQTPKPAFPAPSPHARPMLNPPIMARLPPLPSLDWQDAGAPVSTDLDDVYFSGDGLSEKRAVFLGGCHLPEAWAGREQFVIGELGFGTGLNFLAAQDIWRRHRPSPTARLHVLSFEGALISASDAARIHALWPELAGLSADLRARWPVRARGVQRIACPGGVFLTLHIDDIAAALPEADAKVDAWFLDGFAPSKNPAMWTPDVFAHIARLSAPGARAATYTVAGAVRRGLEQAGFSVAKRPGHGRKNERLEAVFTGAPTNQPANHHPSSPHILIIGAGVAGAAAARTCLDRHARVTVLDAGAAPASGASGNPIALVMPRLDAADGPPARGLIEAYLLARRTYLALGPDAACALDVHHLPRSDAERTRFARLLSDPPLDTDALIPLDPANASSGLIHRGAVAVQPAIAIPALLAGAALRLSATVASLQTTETAAIVTLATGETIEADSVIVCAAMGMNAIGGVEAPGLTGRLGQIEHAPSPLATAATADGGYAVVAFNRLLFGATFEAATDGASPVTSAARRENLETLRRLYPDMDIAAQIPLLASRAAIRATTQDRLPFAGRPSHDKNEKAPKEHPALSGPALSDRIRLIGGLGSRGYLWAPLLAELVVASLFGEPAPAERSVIVALDPDRFRQRALKKQK